MQQPTINNYYNTTDPPLIQLTIFTSTDYLNPGMFCLLLTQFSTKYKLTQYLWNNFNRNFSPDNMYTDLFLTPNAAVSSLLLINSVNLTSIIITL